MMKREGAMRKRRKVTKVADSKKKKSPLLRLPSELRNDIYRFSFIQSSDKIMIGPEGLAQPGFLRASQQLRRETSSIYYEENRFAMLMTNLRCLVPVRHWVARRLPHSKRSIRTRGNFNWPNLKKWLETYHQASGRGAYFELIASSEA